MSKHELSDKQTKGLVDFETSIVQSIWTDADTDRIMQDRIDKEYLHLDDVDELTMA